MSESAPLPPGMVVRNTYTIDRLLGSGGFADVYLVRHRFMGMQAMKVFRERSFEDGVTLREAFLLAKFGHPNIVRVYEANLLAEEDGAREYLTMEFVDGCTLDRYLQQHAPLSIRRCLEITCQAAAGLAQAHGFNPPIVHRDIKPQNLLLFETPTGAPQLKLADFGLAMPLGRYTNIAQGAGTLLYMSPECLDGFAVPASDVWSLGIVLFQLLTGLLPYPHALTEGRITRGEWMESLREAQREPLRPPSFFRRDVPVHLDALVGRALHADRRRRYADATEFLEELQAYRLETGGAGRDARPAETQKLVARAYDVARQAASLPIAVELLERAIAQQPSLRDEHGADLEMWRKGIAFHG